MANPDDTPQDPLPLTRSQSPDFWSLSPYKRDSQHTRREALSLCIGALLSLLFLWSQFWFPSFYVLTLPCLLCLSLFLTLTLSYWTHDNFCWFVILMYSLCCCSGLDADVITENIVTAAKGLANTVSSYYRLFSQIISTYEPGVMTVWLDVLGTPGET